MPRYGPLVVILLVAGCGPSPDRSATNDAREPASGEESYLGQPTSYWEECLGNWFIDSQMFMGGPGESVTFYYPRWGRPGPNGIEQGKWTKDDDNVKRLMGGDPKAQPVLLALFQLKGKDSLHELAIYGLAKVDKRSPATVATLKSIPENDKNTQAIIRAASQREPVKIPMIEVKELEGK